MTRRVLWTKRATRQLNKSINYIRLVSDQNADKVRERILEKIDELSDDRIIHRKDPYKKIMMAIIYILKS